MQSTRIPWRTSALGVAVILVASACGAVELAGAIGRCVGRARRERPGGKRPCLE